MKISKLNKWLGAALLATALSVSGGIVLAQPDDNAPSPGDPPEPPQQPDVTPPVPAEVPDTQDEAAVEANLDLGETIAEADGIVGTMRAAMKRINQLQEVAHKRQDIMKLNCVNERKALAEKALQTGESARSKMETESNTAYLTDVKTANDFIQQYKSEAEQCIGEDLSYLGDTETECEGCEDEDESESEDPDLPEVDILPTQSDPT